jgi:hypothetical protein
VSPDVQLALELIRTAASVAIPFVLVWAAHTLQRRQKSFEAVMSEKARHYAALSPLVNKVFAFRMELGDFLLWAPEEILAAKRKADEAFWTFEYLWSEDFRRVYLAFMDDSFKMWGPKGSMALIRVVGAPYLRPPSYQGWKGFSGDKVDRARLARLYADLKAAIARDLGFRGYAPQLVGRPDPFPLTP